MVSLHQNYIYAINYSFVFIESVFNFVKKVAKEMGASGKLVL